VPWPILILSLDIWEISFNNFYNSSYLPSLFSLKSGEKIQLQEEGGGANFKI